ncbi:MAG: DUF2878 family protein [Myxococcales bacterium]|nr:DUF2878 family protein [Myxococcales bacterium]MCB9547225.1 DUF2878 family protein [Myxococcales bacterium]
MTQRDDRPPGPARGAALFVAYYGSWWLVVRAAASGAPGAWPALALVVSAAGWRWSGLPLRRFLAFALAFAAVGVVGDAVCLRLGLVAFESPGPLPLLPPLWMAALWLLFSGTFPVTMRWLYGRPVAAAVGGAVFAPLSYLACDRLGCLHLALPTALGLGLAWAALLAVIAARAPRWLG